MSAIIAEESYARVRWGGVWAGLVTSIVTYLFLAVLGAAVGLVAYQPGGDEPSVKSIAIGAGLWLAICTIAAAYLGGFVGGRSAGSAATKAQGRYTGLLTGMLMLLLLTTFTANTITQGITTIFGMAGSVVGTGVRAGSQAAGAAQNIDGRAILGRLGLQDEYQAITNGLDRGELNHIVTQAAPELTPEQANAATDAVSTVFSDARRDLTANLGNIGQLDENFARQADTIQNRLSGGEFLGLLQARGLNEQQARGVASAVNNRIGQLREQARSAMQTVNNQVREAADTAADTIGTAAWLWLLSAVLILGSAMMGGQNGANALPERQYVDRRARADVLDADEERRRRAQL